MWIKEDNDPKTDRIIKLALQLEMEKLKIYELKMELDEAKREIAELDKLIASQNKYLPRKEDL